MDLMVKTIRTVIVFHVSGILYGLMDWGFCQFSDGSKLLGAEEELSSSVHVIELP